MCSRFIDFLLEDKVIIEIDGMHHVYPYYYENNDITIYRNMHLLLAGYRVIVISIHEYNLNREVEQLTQLLKYKMETLNEGARVFVS